LFVFFNRKYIAVHAHAATQGTPSGICNEALLSLHLLQPLFGLIYIDMVKALFDTSLFGTFAGFRNSATPPIEIVQKCKT
jgi:hypothetical protein